MSVYYSATEKNKITSFVSNVDEPRVCHPREGSQKVKNTRYERMYLESRKMALIKLLAGQEERRRHREQTCGHSGERSSVQSLSRVQLFAAPWTAARQASLSITNSWRSLRLTSIESVMPSNHPILCHPLLLLPPIPPSIRVFSNESALRIRWPKVWSFSFTISPSNEHP